jgi:hypothetical protein
MSSAKFNFKIIPEHKTVFEHYEGETTYDDLKRFTLQKIVHPFFDPSYATVSDISGMDPKYTIQELKSFVEQAQRDYPGRQTRMIALIADNPKTAAHAYMYYTFAQKCSSGIVNTFTSVEAALHWLGKGSNYLDSLSEHFRKFRNAFAQV